MIKSIQHYKTKKRLFNRLFEIGIDNKDQDALKDAWKISNELLNYIQVEDYFGIEFRELYKKRYIILDLLDAKKKIELGLYK